MFCTESPRNLWALRFCKLVENETSINLFILLRNLNHAQKGFIKVDKKSSCYFIHQSLCLPKPPATTTLQHMLYHSRRNSVKPPVTFGQWVVLFIVIIVWLVCLRVFICRCVCLCEATQDTIGERTLSHLRIHCFMDMCTYTYTMYNVYFTWLIREPFKNVLADFVR